MDQHTEKRFPPRRSADVAPKTSHRVRGNNAAAPKTVPPKTTPVVPDRAFAALPNGPKRYIAAKPLARFIPDLTKKVFQKHGFSSANLVADWSDIVGPSLAAQCLPERLKWPRSAKQAATPTAEQKASDATPVGATNKQATGATLILRTDAAYALEIEYASAQILERINAYFGYRAITTLKIVQGPLFDTPDTNPAITPRRRMRDADPDLVRSVESAISDIDDDGLKAALKRMGKSVLTDG